MLRKVTLPDTVFPQGIEPGNAIRSFYKTNLLYPAVGPAASAAYVIRFTRTARHLAIAAAVVARLRDYNVRYKEVPTLGKAKAQALNPRARNVDGYVERFISSVRQSPLLETNGQLVSTLRQPYRLASSTLFSNARRLGAGVDVLAPAAAPSAEALKQRDTALLLQAMAMPNVVFEHLFTAGTIKSQGDIVDAALLGKEPPHVAILTALNNGRQRARQPAVDDRRLTAATPLVRMALRRVARHRGTEMLASFDKSADVRGAMTSYFVGALGELGDISHPVFDASNGFFLPGDEVEAPAAEWAFQRFEELRLAMGTPVLRGPVSATSIAPRSHFLRNDTETTATTETTRTAASRRTRATESRQIVSASSFTSALDGLTESGVADAGAFSQESTLLSTLSEERRAIIDTVAKEISTGFESGSSSMTERTLGRATEYRTEGKDAKFASTELGYQVVVPVQATVLLRDAGLAWCPRAPLPFAPLRENVRAHEKEQRDDYITQYYVPVPVGPVLKSEVVKEHYFEIYLRGRKNVNMKDFSQLIPIFEDNSFIELDEITVIHRNGEWDDAQELPGYGEIPYNYDDLEDARVYLQNLSLSTDGRTLSGTGVLETHDPEFLNVSWLGITVPVRSYTDETVAAVAAFEQAKAERELKLQAVASRARQFGAMKRDELIELYGRTIDHRREAFRGLIRRICLDVPPQQHSYFEELLYRCINWKEASMTLESEEMTSLSYRELAPDHFMNSPGARFFLPIQKGAEKLFFATLERTGHDYFASSANDIKDQLNAYRTQIAEWVVADAPERVLDTHTTELIIGHHLEAFLSESEFST